MHATLFSLVATENPNLIFAWGMEIVEDGYQDGEESRKAIIYIGGATGRETISTHLSAEHACRRWSTVTPLTIVWDNESWADLYRELSACPPPEPSHAQAQP
ncbi:hypothetical protein GCM10027436_09920 [Actinophytocola sediminis]